MAGKTSKIAKKSETSSVASSRKQSVDETKKKDQKKLLLNKKDATKGKAKVVESSSDDSSDSEVEKKPVVGQKRARATSATSEASNGKKAQVQKQAKKDQKAVKKVESSEDSSDSEEEAKPVRKGSIQKKAARAKKVNAESSDDDSSEEDVKVIANKAKAAAKKVPAKKDSDSDEDSDSEEELPKKAVRKQSNVSNKSAGKKAVAKKADSDDEEENGDSETGPSELFVGNLSFKTDESAIRRQFSSYGTITNIKVLTDQQGRSKGSAFVAFSKASEAKAALDAENGNTCDGRELRVNFSSGGGNKGGDAPQRSFGGNTGGDGESTTIFVGNLGFKTDSYGIKNFFSQCGPIKDVRVAMGEDGRPKGFAHVEFESHEAAKAALELNG
jgi:nucleolin